MIGVITGNIINSREIPAEKWVGQLKAFFERLGKSPQDWEIYRGDEFQLKTRTEDAFWIAVCIKALVKSVDRLDVRLAIGFGIETFCSEKVTECNGSAYVNSGKLLKELKAEGRTLAIKTPDDALDVDLNMVFKYATLHFDCWTGVVSEVVHEMLLDKSLTQEELARRLDITQSSISQRIKRANFDLILELDQYFRVKIKNASLVEA